MIFCVISMYVFVYVPVHICIITVQPCVFVCVSGVQECVDLRSAEAPLCQQRRPQTDPGWHRPAGCRCAGEKEAPPTPPLVHLGSCNPPSLLQQVVTAALSRSALAAPCPPPSLAAPRPRPPAGRPPPRLRERRTRGRSGSSEETSSTSTTASTSSRCGTLRSSTRRR